MNPETIIFFQAAINGILVGSLQGIIAMGLTLTWGMLKIANFAHLSFALLAAYIAYSLIVEYAVAPLLTLVVILPLMFLIGVWVQWLFIRFQVTSFTSLLLTFGLFIVLENLITFIWTADTITARAVLPDVLRKAIRFPEPFEMFFVLPADLLAFGMALILALSIHVLLHHTAWGRGVRAMAEDPVMAQAYGVNYRQSACLLSGLATATAGVAGVLIAIKLPLFPSMGLVWLGTTVAAVILGGLGNPIGAFVAASLLIMIQNIWSVRMPPSWAPLIAFTLFTVYLVVQPNLLWRRWRAQQHTPHG
ncbi:branched-chain amino acid ABC transporter permease [Chloroflexi bacterium TSY]|nr:branched-chain amino acid ABC transporter permease [Chloroflexi bacterium TSY]